MEKISFTINIADKISPVIKKITGLFGNLTGEVKKTQSQTQKYVELCNKLKLPDLNASLQLLERYCSSIASATTEGMRFGQSMADLSSITGIVGEELKGLEENSRRLGAESGLGAESAARAYSLLASQIEISKIGIDGLNKLEEKSITLAHASGMSLDGAANALAGTINQFGLGAESADRVINVLAAGSKYGAAEIEDLTQSFKVVGAAASAMGLDVESTAGALEILSQANLKGSEAGTALRNIILKLNTELGIDLSETSLGSALDALKPKLTDATFLSKVFGMENIAAAQFLIQNAEAVDQMTTQLTGTTVAEEQAAVRTATTAQRMQELRASIDNLKIGLADMLGSMAPIAVIALENADILALLASSTKRLYSTMSVLAQMAVKLASSTMVQNIAIKAASAATAIWTGVQKALNLVLSANPIGIVIVAIGALVGAIVYAYNNFEGFRNICNQVWDAVKVVATAVWDYLVKAFENVSEAIKKAWEWIQDFFGIKDKNAAKATAETLDEETDSINANTKAKENNNAVKIDFSSVGNGETNTTVEQKPVTNPESYKELGDAISYYEQKLQETKPTETATIALLQKKIKTYKDAQTVIEQQWASANRPEELNTLNAIDAEIEYQQSLRANATAENIAGIDAEIERLNALKTAIEDSAHVSVSISDITTYDQLEKELAYIESRIKRTSGTMKAEAMAQRKALQDLRDSWELEDKRPGTLSELSSLKELEDARGYYEEKMKRATGSEIEGYQRTVIAIDEKINAIKRLQSLLGMGTELSTLDGLSGKQLKLELELIGVEGIKGKIRELQKMLADTKNPLGDKDRSQVQSMLKEWQKYEKVLKRSQLKMGDVWGTTKGLGNSVLGLTESLKGNGTVWEKVTGVIDSMIAIYQGVSGIIGIVNLLTQGSMAHAVAKGVEAGAVGASATAEVTAGAAETASSVATTTALVAETSAWSALAAAKTIAAHAYIPFAGTAIAAGYIATQKTLITAASIPMFANGGIVYGPTLGLMGEYSGASSNPEIIAPLDKLKSIIGTSGNTGGEVRFRIEGRTLVGILNKESARRERVR